MKTQPDSERLAFTYTEAARAINVSEATIRKMVRSGRIDVIKVGRCRRIPIRAFRQLCGTECGTDQVGGSPSKDQMERAATSDVQSPTIAGGT